MVEWVAGARPAPPPRHRRACPRPGRRLAQRGHPAARAASARVGVLGPRRARPRRGARRSPASASTSRGWSRRPQDAAGPRDLSRARTGSRRCCGAAEILVLLLPATPDTDEPARRRSGSRCCRAGARHHQSRARDADRRRGAARRARRGRLGARHARRLPRASRCRPEHPFWAHPRVTVTPHVAAETRPETASPAIAENIRRGEAGEPFLHRRGPRARATDETLALEATLAFAVVLIVTGERERRQPGFAADGPQFVGRGELVRAVEGAEADLDLVGRAAEDRGAAARAEMRPS